MNIYLVLEMLPTILMLIAVAIFFSVVVWLLYLYIVSTADTVTYRHVNKK